LWPSSSSSSPCRWRGSTSWCASRYQSTSYLASRRGGNLVVGPTSLPMGALRCRSRGSLACPSLQVRNTVRWCIWRPSIIVVGKWGFEFRDRRRRRRTGEAQILNFREEGGKMSNFEDMGFEWAPQEQRGIFKNLL
jgi:hypothetical protein